MRGVRKLWLVLALCAGCAVQGTSRRPVGALETRYRLRHASGGRVNTATSVYRQVLARSLYSDCKMVPSDSEAFNLRAKQCGPLRALVVSVGRLFLEEARGPQFLRPVRWRGGARWLDVPRGDSCGF